MNTSESNESFPMNFERIKQCTQANFASGFEAPRKDLDHLHIAFEAPWLLLGASPRFDQIHGSPQPRDRLRYKTARRGSSKPVSSLLQTTKILQRLCKGPQSCWTWKKGSQNSHFLGDADLSVTVRHLEQIRSLVPARVNTLEVKPPFT